jgi:hypothetical protein
VSPQRDPEPSAVPSGAQPRPSRAEPGTVSALKLDHELVEEMMSGLSKKARAEFWREHVHIIGTAFLDRDMSREEVEAILWHHFEGVRKVHQHKLREKRRAGYPINFKLPPDIGTIVKVGKRIARLEWIEPIVRKSDGQPSWVLHWDVDGRHATSGLRGASLCFAEDDDA